MHQRHYHVSLMPAVQMLLEHLATLTLKYGSNVVGTMNQGHFLPQIDHHAFIKELVDECFIQPSSLGKSIPVQVDYPQVCYQELKRWGISTQYWKPICRDVFNELVQCLIHHLPDIIVSPEHHYQYDLCGDYDLLFCHTHYSH